MSIGLAIYLQHEDYINFCFLESKTTCVVVIVRFFREVLINVMILNQCYLVKQAQNESKVFMYTSLKRIQTLQNKNIHIRAKQEIKVS